MRIFFTTTIFAGALLMAATLSSAEAQPGGKKDKGGKGGGGTESVAAFVSKMMAFNKAKDGKLTKSELTDPRLVALFTRADANKDNVVTQAELEALFAREKVEGGGFGGDKGKGGPGDKKGKGGFGGDQKGKGIKGGPPMVGQILPLFLQEALKLTDAQKSELADLQKVVDTRLDSILTEAQRTQLRDLRAKGPGGFGPPGKK